jgi:hypothetical protein
VGNLRLLGLGVDINNIINFPIVIIDWWRIGLYSRELEDSR